jgi:hypothetical protein
VAGAPLLGERRVASQYVEIAMPVYKTKQLGSAELQVAARHETYSDFGSTTKPKVAGKITLPENKFVNLIVRGSFSESFQASALGLLYASQTVAFSSGLLQDPLRPQDPPVQMRIAAGRQSEPAAGNRQDEVCRRRARVPEGAQPLPERRFLRHAHQPVHCYPQLDLPADGGRPRAVPERDRA